MRKIGMLVQQDLMSWSTQETYMKHLMTFVIGRFCPMACLAVSSADTKFIEVKNKVKVWPLTASENNVSTKMRHCKKVSQWVKFIF